jgi:AcrR family transcriptional regulator
VTQTARRTGRRGGDSGTRTAILAAARKRFAGLGYDGATIRGIAADAGVDPALVHHFFGTKERLFAAAMRLPVVPGELIGAVLAAPAAGAGPAAESLGERLVRGMLGAWDVHEIRDTFLGLLRSAATSEQAMTMLRQFVTDAILGRLSAAARAPDQAQARLRAALIASQVVGLGVTRYLIGLEPLTEASTDELVAAIGPALDRYLAGDLS